MLRIIFLFGLVVATFQAASANVVRIADGDCSALSSAVAATSAATNPGTTVLLARNGNYAGCSILANSGTAVVVDGQGSRMQGFSACAANVGSSIALRDMTILPSSDPSSQPNCTVARGGTTGSFIFCSTLQAASQAALSLETVTLQGFDYPACSAIDQGVIYSEGSLSLRNVTATQMSDTLIASTGTLEIYNSTFTHNAAVNPNSSKGLPLISYQTLDPSAYTNASIANSLFAENSGSVCGTPSSTTSPGAGYSLGGNVSDASVCGFSTAAGDKIVADVGMAAFGNNGGLVPTQPITGVSAAHRAGIAKYCEAVDARGYTRAASSCDAGAYEYGGGSGALTAGGMNGVFYDPNANGHYVSIQRIHDNGDILIIWNTFDQKGNPAWVYGVGQLTDQHIHAQMAQNLGGVLQPGGPAVGAQSRTWGAVDIDLTSCLLAQFNYESNFSEFGSGAFPLTRLAIVADFGCSD